MQAFPTAEYASHTAGYVRATLPAPDGSSSRLFGIAYSLSQEIFQTAGLTVGSFVAQGIDGRDESQDVWTRGQTSHKSCRAYS